MTHVAIAIATYRRPQMLAECLRAVARLLTDCDVTVIVVDNDRDGSARATVEAAAVPVVYDIVPERNISLARNRSVEIALREHVDFVAFVDDDETPQPDWLAELLRAQNEFSADVVWGPAVPRFPPDAPKWIVDGRFFEAYGDWPRGRATPFAYTSNALVAEQTLRAVAGPFDPAFGLSGGGDADFSRRARAAGARIIWTPTASVDDHIHGSRLSARWILRRAFRVGNASALIARGATSRTRLAGTALVQIAAGLVLLLSAAFRGRAAAVHALRRIAGGAGALSGIGGYRFIEYRETHGR